MTEQRARIVAHVVDHPGTHFNELLRELELATGQAQYHLHRLVRQNEIRRAEFYGRTHYFPLEWTEWERGAIAMARRETARDVLLELLERGPSEPQAIADALDVARSTLEWHLDHLVELDVVRKERDSRNRVTLVLMRPRETMRVLETVDPTLSETFVDRFIRLTDSLLDL